MACTQKACGIYTKACGTKAPWHVHKRLLYACGIYSMRIVLHETLFWQKRPSVKTGMPDWNWMPVVQSRKACLVANKTHWAVWYDTWLRIKLMPKGVVFSFLFLANALMFIVVIARHWRRHHSGVNRRGGIHRTLGMGMHAHASRMYYACTMHALCLCFAHACAMHACCVHEYPFSSPPWTSQLSCHSFVTLI